MKKFLATVLVITASILTIYAQNNKAYNIKISIKGLKDSTCYLAHFYLNAKSQIIKDTAIADNNGNVVFVGNEPLPKGIYIVTIGKTKSMQLIIGSENLIEMEADTSMDISGIKIKTSNENKAFYEYQNFMTESNNTYKNLTAGGDAKKNEALLKEIQNKIQKFQIDFFEKYKNTTASLLLKAPQQPNIPESPKLANGKIDSTFALHWIQNHFFDNMDLSDEMFIKTPYLDNKVEYYLDNLNYQIPDSLNKAADFMMNKAKSTKNMQKYLASHIASRYERPTFMGGDAVFVHMAEKYFIGMPALWDSSTLAPINEKKNAVKNVLLGQKAQNAQLTDTTGSKLMPLYDVKAKYTLLFLYDPECGHCRERAPKLVSFYDKMKKYDLKVYAASTVNDVAKIKKFVADLKTSSFINVFDNLNITDFKNKYNVYTTPQVILLDADKKIIARSLDENQMEDLINKLEKGAVQK